MTREEAIKWIKGHHCTDLDCQDSIAMRMAVEALEQQKEGHNCNVDYADCDQFVCSECGIELQDWQRVERQRVERVGDTSYHEYVFRFCPNCGAKMEEETCR